jgi:hypothetical protein
MLNEFKNWCLYQLGLCPICKSKLDGNFHGVNKEYDHCHKCQFCTYDIYAKEMRER